MLHRRFWKVMPELLRSRAVFPAGVGQMSCSGTFLSLCRFFDHEFCKTATRLQAEEHAYPALIPVDALRKLEYFSSFPQHATFAAPGRLAHAKHVLSPAICYHTYKFLENGRLPREPYCVTAAGPCFRHEPDMTPSPERLWNFTMREVIFFGTSLQVERLRQRLMRSVARLATRAGITANLVEALDPFFLGESRGKLLLQKLKKLKYELRAEIQSRKDLAIASFNNHEDFFSKRMNIRLADGSLALSGCAAFGLERWAFAFLCQNGTEPRRWPEPLRSAVAR